MIAPDPVRRLAGACADQRAGDAVGSMHGIGAARVGIVLAALGKIQVAPPGPAARSGRWSPTARRPRRSSATPPRSWQPGAAARGGCWAARRRGTPAAAWTRRGTLLSTLGGASASARRLELSRAAVPITTRPPGNLRPARSTPSMKQLGFRDRKHHRLRYFDRQMASIADDVQRPGSGPRGNWAFGGGLQPPARPWSSTTGAGNAVHQRTLVDSGGRLSSGSALHRGPDLDVAIKGCCSVSRRWNPKGRGVASLALEDRERCQRARRDSSVRTRRFALCCE